MYLAGGSRDGELTAEVFEVHLKDRTVFPLPSMKKPRANFFMLTDRKAVYCIGGTGDGLSAHFERYSPEKREWTELAPLEQGFEPSFVVNDKYFICAFSDRQPQFFLK